MELANAPEPINPVDAEFVAKEGRVPNWVMPLVKGGVFVVDAVLAAACFILAFIIRHGDPVFSQTAWAWSQEFVPYAGILFFLIPVRVSVLIYSKIYRLRGAFSYTAEFIKIFRATLVGSLLMITFTFLFRSGFAFRDFSYSRGIFLLDFGLTLGVFSFFHLGLRFIQTRIRKRGVNLIPTLVVGANGEARQTIRELKQRQYLGYQVVGMITTENSGKKVKRGVLDFPRNKESSQATDFEGVTVFGDLDCLPRVIREMAIQEVIITDSGVPSEKLFEEMMQSGRERRVEFRLAPSLFNCLPQKTSVEQVGVLPLVRLFCEPLSDTERFFKRLCDVLLSTVALVVLMPLGLIISLLIKLDSRGKIFFKQERVGMDGRKFLCYKFRTMQADADEGIHRESYKKNIDGKVDANSGDIQKPVFGKVKNDSRITKIGNLLRRSSLDELPQLINVLKGDMSIVGPRPPIPYEVEEYEAWHRKRLDMKPGITGLWQVSGRNRLTFDEMVRIDLFYIENWSIWLDIKIMILTLPAVLRGDGAK